MPKEVVVNQWCDPCYQDGEHTEAEEVTIALGDLARMRPRTVLLCERHRKEHYEPLRELLEAFGSVLPDTPAMPTAAKRPKGEAHLRGPFKCEVEGCTARPLISSGSFSSHVRKQHGISGVKEYRRIYGELKRVGTEEEAETTPEPDLFEGDDADESTGPIGGSEAVCEVPGCGKVYSHALGNNRPAQALGVHLARAHGIMSPKKQAS